MEKPFAAHHVLKTGAGSSSPRASVNQRGQSFSAAHPDFKDPIAGSTIPQPSNLTRQSFDALPEIVRRGLNAVPEWLQKPEAFQAELRSEYALISRSDLAVGQICQALKEQGFDDNTVIIHISNAEPLT